MIGEDGKRIFIPSIHVPVSAGIYKFTSPSGRVYIGRAVNLRHRHYEHKRNRRRDTLLGKSFAKYGFEAHSFEVICEVPRINELLNDLEKHYIRLYNSYKSKYGLNLTSGGDGTMGRFVTESQREKMSKALKGRAGNTKGYQCSEETKIKISNTLKGQKLSRESIEKGQIAFLDSGKSKPILDTLNGIYYISIREAAECLNIWRNTLKRRLSKNSIPNLSYV